MAERRRLHPPAWHRPPIVAEQVGCQHLDVQVVIPRQHLLVEEPADEAAANSGVLFPGLHSYVTPPKFVKAFFGHLSYVHFMNVVLTSRMCIIMSQASQAALSSI